MTYIDKKKVSLKDLIKLRKKEYKKFSPVQCYMLKKETVYFTFDGFEHLHMDGQGSRRDNEDAYSRLLLMEHAPHVITNSRMIKEDKPKIKKGKVAIHYELHGKVGRNNLNVVVTLRKLGNGGLHFYGIRQKNKKAGKKPAS